jgi:hypothetical protein
VLKRTSPVVWAFERDEEEGCDKRLEEEKERYNYQAAFGRSLRWFPRRLSWLVCWGSLPTAFEKIEAPTGQVRAFV